jgi:hypothetical protein
MPLLVESGQPAASAIVFETRIVFPKKKEAP